jgi:hypothetical protein
MFLGLRDKSPAGIKIFLAGFISFLFVCISGVIVFMSIRNSILDFESMSSCIAYANSIDAPVDTSLITRSTLWLKGLQLLNGTVWGDFIPNDVMNIFPPTAN